MKKLMIALAVVAVAAVSQAASAVWGSGTVKTPSGDNALASVTAYMWVIDATTYATYSGITDGKAMSDAIWGAYGSNLASADKSGKTAKSVKKLTDDSTDYGVGDTAYAALIYTYGTGDELQYIGNVGAMTFESALNKESGSMALYLFGDNTKGATAWSTAAVPEPTSGLLMLLGMAGLALRRRRA